MSADRAAGERSAEHRRSMSSERGGGGAGPATTSYLRLYALVIAVLAADIAVLVWLTERWK